MARALISPRRTPDAYGKTTTADHVVMLPGNHELEFLDVLAGNDTWRWILNGGRTVMTEVNRDWSDRPWDDGLPDPSPICRIAQRLKNDGFGETFTDLQSPDELQS